MKRDPELMRRINANLIALRNGTVRRELDEVRNKRAAEKAALRARSKEDKAELRRIDKSIKATAKERDGLQSYLDELLERPGDLNPLGYAEGGSEQQYQGLLEEIEIAIYGCNRQIGSLQDEKRLLKGNLDR